MNARPLCAVAAGGTGGHLYPAVALAEELGRRGYRVIFLTDERGAEYDGLASDVDRLVLTAGRIDRGRLRRLYGIAKLARGVLQARRIYRRTPPSLVVGFGGYPSIAPTLAARLCRVPCILHEQNARLGRANRLAARFATAIALSFASTARVPPTARTHLVGNPVRRDFIEMAKVPYEPPAKDGPVNILVLGGSQGATVFSKVVPAAVENLVDRRRLRIVHQCRREDLDQTREAYASLDIPATVATFFDDMAGLLRDAHLVVSRAGASTMAELGAVGRPAILVPYPYAAEGHQMENATALEAAGGGWVFMEADLSADKLGLLLSTLIDAPATLATTAEAARSFGRRDAAARLADLVIATASTPLSASRSEVVRDELDQDAGPLQRGLA